MNNTLSLRKAAIIGGTSGIGRAAAEFLARKGYAVLATGRDTAKVQTLTDFARDERLPITVVESSAPSTDALRAFAPIGHLILCAGGARGIGPIATLDVADLRAGFDNKFWLHIAALQAALPLLDERGSITFVTAVSAQAAAPGTAGLAALNGALERMVPPLAVELAPRRVNAISPGMIDTPWWSVFPEEMRDRAFSSYAKTVPARRVGTADDVASAIALVVENDFITGETLVIDGGARHSGM